MLDDQRKCESLNYNLKCKQIFEEALPFNHPDLPTIYNNLASLFLGQEKCKESFDYYSKCLQICEEVLPSNHPCLATMYNNLWLLFDNQEKCEESYNYDLKCNQIRDEVLSSNHINLSIDSKNSEPYALHRKNKKNASNEFIILDRLKIYKSYFIEPYWIKYIEKETLIYMEKAKWSLYELKDKIMNENKILFSESDIKNILQQIIEAYAILKKERIVHSDVHPGNILIGFDNRIRLIDFE